MNKSFSQPKPVKPIPLLLLGLGLTLFAASLFLFRQNAATALPTEISAVPVKANFSAPKVTLTDTRGEAHSLSDYHGQVVLVNLWATWCPPCKAEMPTLQAYYKKYNGDGFTIIAINDGDPAADVLQFEKDYQLTFPIWLDPEYYATEQAFKTLNLPSSFLIDRAGTVRLQWVGAISRKMLDQYVTPIIMENQ
ncbi:MAG: TlpA disulfide reductase family protein [Anaerolineales bacterium]